MRVVASILPGLGHLNPMVPLLRELAARGHDVEVVVPPPFVPFVERVGLRASGVGPSWTEAAIDHVEPGWHALGAGDHLRVWMETATALLPHLRRHVELARPDVIVHDQYEFAGWLVAERLGIPSVPYAMTLRCLEPDVVELCGVGDAVARMRADAGLDPDRGVDEAARWLYFDAMPPSMSAGLLPGSATVHHVRHVADDGSGCIDGACQPPLRRATDRPLVYVTMGTVFNRTPGVLDRLASGAAAVPDVDVLVTVGHDGTAPLALPANVTVAPYVPQRELYDRLSAVVCHGGFGTTFGALGRGVPVACAPIAADQPMNAALVAAAGAGVNLASARSDGQFPILGMDGPDPEQVSVAVEQLLGDPSFARHAQELASEMAAGARPAEAAVLVERVVAGGAPVPPAVATELQRR